MMLSVAEAQARVLALGAPLAVERAALVEAAGRHAAGDVIARRSQPAADLSAMDGYALRFAELPGPWAVAGESKAGGGLGRALSSGEAARIFTGAPLPPGADTVLVQEEASRDGAMVRLADAGPPRVGAHVRREGSDFGQGAVLVAPGERFTPARLALAALGGHGEVAVRARPRVALLSTGDELVAPGLPATGVMLPASNGPMLHALLHATPALIDDRGIVADRLDLLAQAFTEAARRADVIVTTGGASVGDHDLVRPALARAGATLDFWKVAMRPGKPLMAGRLGDAVVLGLPGNPVSAYVTGLLFLLPLVRHLGGDPDPLPPSTDLPLASPLPPTVARADYVRARLRHGRAEPLIGQDSAAVAMLARTELLIVRPADAPAVDTGDLVETIRVA